MAANIWPPKSDMTAKRLSYSIVFILLYLQQKPILQQWYHGRWLDLEEAINF